MTVWLTPDREPFYGGTYFPPRDGVRGGGPGFLTVLGRVVASYRDNPGDVSATADKLTARVRQVLEAVPKSNSSDAGMGDLASFAARVADSTLAASAARFDSVNGGTLGAPKFPSALPLRALLRHHRRSGNAEALRIVTATLGNMADGGIRDHLAGGFHRYSVDSRWLVPHFEKMLYDNALLATTYTEAWQATGQAEFARVAREILDWTSQEMTSSGGGFYSATDADSRTPEGALLEGHFFTWKPEETLAALGTADASVFDAAYGVTAAGNFEGRSVLHQTASVDDIARKSSLSTVDTERILDSGRARVLAARNRRPRPLRDDKIVTAWNGLMISAAARASVAFANDGYRRLAARAADSLLLGWNTNGRLVRSTLGDRAQQQAFLDDYAFLEAGLLDLFEAGDGHKRLEQAIALDTVIEKEFEDASGGFFLTPLGDGALLAREKSRTDGAEPSGGSVEILNLLRLAELTGDARYRDRAERALAALADLFATSPLSVSDALLALDFANDATIEVVLVTTGGRPSLTPFLHELAATFVPNRVLISVTSDSPATVRLPLTEGKIAMDGKPTAYVCEGRVCDLPTHDVAIFASQLRRVRRVDK